MLRSFGRLHIRGGYGASGYPRHAPKHTLTSHLLPDHRKCQAGEVVFEVTVRVADQKSSCGDAAPPFASTGQMPSCRSLKTTACANSLEAFRLRCRKPRIREQLGQLGCRLTTGASSAPRAAEQHEAENSEEHRHHEHDCSGRVTSAIGIIGRQQPHRPADQKDDQSEVHVATI